jgi:Holliday junction DNA helicase RuvA
VLSALTADELADVVETADLARLQRTPGVGRKTAERILLELKDRLIAASPGTGDRRGDAVSALVNLGYSQRDALRSVDAVWSDATDGDLGELLRLALQKLTR